MKFIRLAIIFLFIGLVSISIITVIHNTSGFSNVIGYNANPVVGSLTLMRLVGLIGITLLSVQLTIGSSMKYVERVFGDITFTIHKTLGATAYCLILIHPISYFLFNFLLGGLLYAWQEITIPSHITVREEYIFLGKLALLLLTIAVLAAINRNRTFISSFWRKLHVFNYAVFALVIIHSFLVGDDSRTLPFVLLYPYFILVLLIALFSTFYQRAQKRK